MALNLNLYQELKRDLKDLQLQYLEIRNKINNSGFPSSGGISDMPRGGNKDSTDMLVVMLDEEDLLKLQMKVLRSEVSMAREMLEHYLSNVKHLKKREVMRMKHLEGLTFNEIAKKLNKSVYAIKKTYKRNP